MKKGHAGGTPKRAVCAHKHASVDLGRAIFEWNWAWSRAQQGGMKPGSWISARDVAISGYLLGPGGQGKAGEVPMEARGPGRADSYLKTPHVPSLQLLKGIEIIGPTEGRVQGTKPRSCGPLTLGTGCKVEEPGTAKSKPGRKAGLGQVQVRVSLNFSSCSESLTE